MLQIRPVAFTEVDILRNFAEHTFRIAFEADNDPLHFERYCRETFTPDKFSAQWHHPQSEFWFGEWEGILTAYLKLNFDRTLPQLSGARAVQVERLYVDPHWQGRRIGESMLEQAQARAQARDAEWLWLSVWQANPPALRFYERCGYEIFGTETFWVGDDPQTDWLVKKPVRRG